MKREMIDLLREAIILNEVGSNLDLALSFSDPDGIRSGKSGWSFGACQFDTQNNDQAIACLQDCGFTGAEISGIVAQTIDIKPLNRRLQNHAGVIIEYDNRQLAHCLRGAIRFASDHSLPVGETAAMIALADTINQYGSLGDATARKLANLARPITAQDILEIKLTWKYARRGERQRKDTIRRHDNIIQVVSKDGLPNGMKAEDYTDE